MKAKLVPYVGRRKNKSSFVPLAWCVKFKDSHALKNGHVHLSLESRYVEVSLRVALTHGGRDRVEGDEEPHQGQAEGVLGVEDSLGLAQQLLGLRRRGGRGHGPQPPRHARHRGRHGLAAALSPAAAAAPRRGGARSPAGRQQRALATLAARHPAGQGAQLRGVAAPDQSERSIGVTWPDGAL